MVAILCLGWGVVAGMGAMAIPVAMVLFLAGEAVASNPLLYLGALVWAFIASFFLNYHFRGDVEEFEYHFPMFLGIIIGVSLLGFGLEDVVKRAWLTLFGVSFVASSLGSWMQGVRMEREYFRRELAQRNSESR